MATERYGIDLDVNLTGFKTKMNEAKNEAKSLGQALREVNKFDVVGGQGISIFSDKISIASGKARALGNSFKLIRPAIQESTVETERLNNQIIQTSNVGRNVGNNIATSFNKGLRSVKRLTIGFLGARSLFSLFRQQLNAYRSENEAFNQQMALTSNIITTALAPAFEWFGNMIQYATLALAKIIDIMFGTNISSKVLEAGLAKANTQLAGMSSGMNDVSDSAKEMKDNLLGIDEITNLQQEGTGTGLLSGLGGGGADLGNIKDQFKALDDLKKKMKEVNEWFKNHPEITNFFKALGNIIKGFVAFAIKHPWTTLLGIGTFMTLKGLLPSIIGSKSTGMLGLVGASKLLIAVGVTTWAYETMVALDKSTASVEKHAKKVSKTAKNWQKVIDKKTEYMKLTGDYTEAEKTQRETSKVIDNLEDAKKQLKSQLTLKLWIFDPVEYYDIKDKIKNIDKQIDKMKKSQNKITTNQEIANGKIGNSVKLTDQMQKNLEKSAKKAQAVKDNSKINLKVNTKQADRTMETWLDKWKNLNVKVNTSKKANGGIFAGSWQPITAYAGGGSPLGGEMFVAREAGPELVGTIGGHTAVMNNDQIVASVSAGVYQAVASAMSGQGNRPIVLNINGKEFAKATYGDYQEENARRGANTSIRRV